MRRNQFTVNAESIQGNAGAEVTFKGLLVEELAEYRATNMTDRQLVEAHLVDWKGIVDDNDKPLPSPKDEPGIIGKLYTHGLTQIARLLFQGPDEISPKN